MRKRFWLPIPLLACCFLLCGCKVQLYDSLEERQANEIYAALLECNVTASKAAGEENTWKVLVEESQFAASMRILESRGLPRPKFESLGQVFKKSGILSSPMEERARYVYALSEELSRTLCEMDGVLSARVHIVLPQESELGEKVTPAAVSVFVKYSEASAFDVPARTADVRKLVGSSIQGLSADNIQIVMCPSSVLVEPVSYEADPYIEIMGAKTVRRSARTPLLCGVGLVVLLLLGGGGWLFFRRAGAKKAKQGGGA